MVKQFVCPQRYTDDEIKKLEGDLFTEKDFHVIVREDADVYGMDHTGGTILLFKFRKRVISPELCKIGFDNFKHSAKPSRSRGAASGPIDPEAVYWKKREVVDVNKWRTKYMNGSTKSKMMVNNPVCSNAMGYYEASPNFKLPCRMTHHTKVGLQKFQAGMPFIEKIDELYKQLLPEKHQIQYTRASSQPNFQVSDTAFSTITANRNFRTALHKDSGDFGFGNLSVLEHGKYSGGYTGFPQYGVGFDLRQGDFVVMDVHQFHCNTPLYETPEDEAYNETIENVYKRDNPEVGTLGICKKYSRLSFVCYLREKIYDCSSDDVVDTETGEENPNFIYT